jgi:DNA polymerase III delta prime subunit
MALRGKKPDKTEKRLKALFYGSAGVGKTTAAIQFPKPYLIDTEKGSENDQYVDLLNKNEGAVFQTYDFEELINEIKALLTEKHSYKTLIIDPLTTLYDDLLNKSAEYLKRQSKEKDATGTEFGRHYGEADKKMRRLFNLLLRLDMNVIITSHAKNLYNDNQKVIGQTFDCYKKLDYLFDLVFEIKKVGKERIGFVKKTRIKGFDDAEQFPFNYEEIAKRYGRDILEKEAEQENLATKEQVDEITRYIELLKVPEEISGKWLTKSNSEAFDEMKYEDIQKCIDLLKSKINGEESCKAA